MGGSQPRVKLAVSQPDWRHGRAALAGQRAGQSSGRAELRAAAARVRVDGRVPRNAAHRVIVKALHSDRRQYVEPSELADAERLFIALKPLFIED
jgi:hypothetical protein